MSTTQVLHTYEYAFDKPNYRPNGHLPYRFGLSTNSSLAYNVPQEEDMIHVTTQWGTTRHFKLNPYKKGRSAFLEREDVQHGAVQPEKVVEEEGEVDYTIVMTRKGRQIRYADDHQRKLEQKKAKQAKKDAKKSQREPQATEEPLSASSDEETRQFYVEPSPIHYVATIEKPKSRNVHNAKGRFYNDVRREGSVRTHRVASLFKDNQ